MSAGDLAARAKAILVANDRGRFTIPSSTLYPHQWNWDSAFSAMGWAFIEPNRGLEELIALCDGQWQDGMIPHILFRGPVEDYEPGPTRWKTVGAPSAPTAVATSSITQPPIAATALRYVIEHATNCDTTFLDAARFVAHALERWHAWFLATRDPGGDGVVCIVHPWESGMDNAPRWDRAMAAFEPGPIEYRRVDNKKVDAAERPLRADYDRYFFLLAERARHAFAPPDPTTETLCIADVAMTSILCRAEEDLAAVMVRLGLDAGPSRLRHQKIVQGLWHKLFVDGRFCDFDLGTNQPILVEHVTRLLPLFALSQGNTEDQRSALGSMMAALADPSLYAATWPVPTVPPADPHFETRRYWRGPTWINVNWMLIDGLDRMGAHGQARYLGARTLELVDRFGFWEYFDPLTGQGRGAADFSWTAALVLDLLAR